MAVYVDLNYKGIGLFHPPSRLWSVLGEELTDSGVIERDPTRREHTPEHVTAGIRSWLDQKPTRRLLVLLDEVDAMLETDHADNFPVTQRIRGLMDETGRRCKFVLAGLNLVQRFEQGINQPLAHVAGSNLKIGPLDARDAYKLVEEPMRALGYELAPGLVYSILARTNNQASIIQLVCNALVERLRQQPLPLDMPPIPIQRAMVDAQLDEPELRQEIRRRFEWTVGLDQRYQAIAYRVALESLSGRTQLSVCGVRTCGSRCSHNRAVAGRMDHRQFLVALDLLYQRTGGDYLADSDTLPGQRSAVHEARQCRRAVSASTI